MAEVAAELIVEQRDVDVEAEAGVDGDVDDQGADEAPAADSSGAASTERPGTSARRRNGMTKEKPT